MDCTMYLMRVIAQEPASPAPQPRKSHRPPVKVSELRRHAADLEGWIEQLSEGGLEYAAAVLSLDQTRRAVYSEIAALTRGGKK